MVPRTVATRLSVVLTTLASYAALFLRGAEQSPSARNVEEVAALLRSVGYEFKAGRLGPSSGTLRHEGISVPISMGERSADPSLGLPAQMTSLYLHIELKTREQVPLLRDPPSDLYDARGTPVFVPHLGRTVSIREQVSLLDRPTRESLKAELDRFWKEALSYALAHRARFRIVEERDWSKVRFDDSETIDRADPASIGRLVDSWGWRYQGSSWGASSNGWIFPATIGRREVDFHESVMDPTRRWKSFDLLGTIAFPKGTDSEAWISSHQAGLAPMKIFPGASSNVVLWQRIDLESGKTLRELRQSIQAFADRIIALEGSTS